MRASLTGGSGAYLGGTAWNGWLTAYWRPVGDDGWSIGKERLAIVVKLNYRARMATMARRKAADYTLRESPRAKRVILKVSKQKGLEIVVPRGFDRRRLPQILKANRAWLEAQLQRAKGAAELAAPAHIDLAAIDEHWQVYYRPVSGTRISIQERHPWELVVEGDPGDGYGLCLALQRWLHVKAQAHLVPWVRQVSQEVGIPFKEVRVRGQTTRWASCSKLGNMSLNRSLLFLPRHLVRHVFLHELCHIKQLDHSPRFWEVLRQLEPDHEGLAAEVRKANRYVDQWVTLR